MSTHSAHKMPAVASASAHEADSSSPLSSATHAHNNGHAPAAAAHHHPAPPAGAAGGKKQAPSSVRLSSRSQVIHA